MTEKGAAGLSILVILLLWAANTAYGYWTDQVEIREEFAVVWPLEVEIEAEEDTDTEEESGAGEKSGAEAEKEFGAEADGDENADENGQQL